MRGAGSIGPVEALIEFAEKHCRPELRCGRGEFNQVIETMLQAHDDAPEIYDTYTCLNIYASLESISQDLSTTRAIPPSSTSCSTDWAIITKTPCPLVPQARLATPLTKGS